MEKKSRIEKMCAHRERQQRVISILRERGGGMTMLELLDYLTSEDVGFCEGEAVKVLIDDPPEELDINYATGLVRLRETVAA